MKLILKHTVCVTKEPQFVTICHNSSLIHRYQLENHLLQAICLHAKRRHPRRLQFQR